MVTETCHKALFNTITRHHHEHDENRRLIEKQERIEDIAQSMREQGTDEEQIKALVCILYKHVFQVIHNCVHFDTTFKFPNLCESHFVA